MVQEYERAVIFRLGRLLSGGSRGPGKYLEYNSARWFFGGGKLLQLHLVFFGNAKTQKLLKRRSCGGELPAAHWCIVAIGIAIFELSGIFFVLPCVENYTKVDLRTSAIDIPPQEVCFMYDQKYYIYTCNSLLQQCSTVISLIKENEKKKELETSKMNCSSPIQLLSNPRMQSYNTQ